MIRERQETVFKRGKVGAEAGNEGGREGGRRRSLGDTRGNRRRPQSGPTFSCVRERDYMPLLVRLISGDLRYRGCDIANYIT